MHSAKLQFSREVILFMDKSISSKEGRGEVKTRGKSSKRLADKRTSLRDLNEQYIKFQIDFDLLQRFKNSKRRY